MEEDIPNNFLDIYINNKLTEIPIFLARVESVMLAKGLSAPQHSTYFVILLDGRDLVGTPGVAEIITRITQFDHDEEHLEHRMLL